MKKVFLLLISLFLVVNSYSQEMIMTSPDVTITSGGTIDESMRSTTGIVAGGKDITATGTLKIPIVFVRFADDNATTSNWPIANLLPTWATNYVDSNIPVNNIYTNNNLSKFYDLSSGGNGSGTLGEFQVIGDVYFISLPQNRADFIKDGDVSSAILNILDDPSGFDVDFTDYDNWQFKVGGTPYNHTNIPDGVLDFMLIYWKSESISLGANIGGVAGLGFSGTITKDGIDIKSSNGVLGFKAQKYGNEHTIWISAHEIGHHQFGMTGGNTGSHFNGRADRYGNIQRFGLMTRSEGHQFSAYERYRLGWLDPVIVTANPALQTIILNETHKSNTDNAIIIPVAYTPAGDLKEYFLLENYHSTNAYSGANPFLTKSLFNHTISKGIIVYHVSEEDFDWPTLSQVDIESAEGLFDWDVVQGASTPTDRLDDLIAPGNPNEANGFDERDTITATAGTTLYSDYYALTPGSTSDTEKKKKRRYDSDDWLGDQEDLFDLSYKQVFTNWSNPSSRKDNGSSSSVGFEIVSYNSTTHQYTVKVAKSYINVVSLAPSKPQNLEISWDGDHPKLEWITNEEDDIQSYKIWKYAAGSSMIAATVTHNSSLTSHTWIDNDVSKPGKFDPIIEYQYKVKAVDNTSKESLYSNLVSIDGTGGIWKNTDYQTDQQKKVPSTYVLHSNYPNPFNPTTTVSYSLPEKGHVVLKVYDVLGKEVAELVNEMKDVGVYSATFDGANLVSGMYIISMQIQSNGGEMFNQSRKILLMK
jgi:hypothetical protein